VNAAEPVLPEASTADRVLPPIAIPVGMAIAAVKEPYVSVTMLAGVVDSVVESILITRRVFAANPLPFTVTDVPADPEVVDSVIEVGDAETSNATGTVKMPSSAVIECLPEAAVLGMLAIAKNVPLLVDCTVAGTVEMVTPSNFIVILLPAPKLEPDIATAELGRPLSGDTSSTGAMTAKVTSVELTPSVAVMT
jgi:hypothetical protein